MADYNLTKSWSSIDTITDNADAGNIGKVGAQITVDADTIVNSGFYSLSGSSPNLPVVLSGTLVVTGGIGSTFATQTFTALTSQRSWFRSQNSGTWQPWREIYHDNGNGVTAAQAATAIKGAKDGKVGTAPEFNLQDWSSLGGLCSFVGASGNAPEAGIHYGISVKSTDESNGIQIAGRTSAFIKIGASASPWREIYHDNGNGVTAAQAATAIKGAKDGNIGVVNMLSSTGTDISAITSPITGFSYQAASTNGLIGSNNYMIAMSASATGADKIILLNKDSNRIAFGLPSDLEELYHTGNTGVLTFSSTRPNGLSDSIVIGPNFGLIDIANDTTAGEICLAFWNPNGQVGGVVTTNTSTAYNTTSDNDLKNVIGKPSDADIDAKFNDIYDCFTTFDWKNGSNDQPVWGFLAWDVIDKGLDFGTDREGPRDMAIGEVYETIPAETEERPILDEDGNETGEFETVVIKEAIEKRVTPAGVDQSKVVPYLVAKIEKQDRLIADLSARLTVLEGK